ncbi:hypothetical protein NGI46_21455 [Peribacillus butanolivorans]|uniref:hypothetical protein n=1 Tax=Peribacillus butanolivorans TaxID=421767 RepID=UPI00207CE31D|nr:hypothetical protein [Peribacillus butanolivorans]MCO0599967.1 hypothetical protein [Peribacillus butanolivorans]
MKLNFVKVSPSQNMTVFITNHVAQAHYAQIANTIMNYEYLNAEQVGFLVAPKNKNSILRLEMSGGEFCGNAILSAAAYCYYKGFCKDNSFLLETSGSETPLACDIEVKSPSVFEARAEMPQPIYTKDVVVNINGNSISGSIVQLKGITHFLTEFWPSKDDFRLILEAVTKKIEDKAIGIIPYRRLMENEYEVLPFVYVKETGSRFFERACGSGTLALGVYLAKKNKECKFKIHQPGGIINVEIGIKNYISTDVRFTCEGFADVNL